LKIWKDRVDKEDTLEDSQIIREVRKNPTGSSSDVHESMLLNVSRRIVCRRLNEAGLKNYICTRKPLVSNKKMKRVEFARSTLVNQIRFGTILFGVMTRICNI